jgi:hypothetical protein
MSSFNATSFPDSLAIVKEMSMTIGSIDDIQVRRIVCDINFPSLFVSPSVISNFVVWFFIASAEAAHPDGALA